MAKVMTTPITKFLGLNTNTDGQFNLQLGEASKQVNWRVTSGYQLKKREGHTTQINSVGNVRGMWYGKLNGTYFFLFASNGHLYKLITGVKTDLGTLTDAPTKFIPFDKKVYILNGSEYKSFDGTTLSTVTGYIPKIAIGTPPTGGGTPFEGNNLLTGKKHQTFNADGIATAYIIAESAVNSIDSVYVNGVLKALTTDYTVNLTTGVITFLVAPPTGQDNVDIYWTKGTGNRSLIENCRFAMDYSGQTDSRVFLWGNTNFKNTRFWSELANGIPSAEYFTGTSQDVLGSGQYAITDMVKQYDRQKIFFENGGGAMYSYYDFSNGIVSFPAFELNEEIGQVAFNQSQIIKNNVFTLQNGVHAWSSSTVRDQTNEALISQRPQDILDNYDLSTAITVNWKEKHEYWIDLGSIVVIYNYLNDTWYTFDNVNATCFLVVNGEMYFGTNGTIEKFDKNSRSDNGAAINAIWEMGFYDFGADWLRKYVNRLWLTLLPEAKARVKIRYETNKNALSDTLEAYYNLATFQNMDFNNFSFLTSRNPQPFRFKIKAKKFVYFKVILISDTLNDTATVLSIDFNSRMGGESK